jgi:hypothetical protein
MAQSGGVADAIEQRQSYVSLKCAFMARLERIEPLNDLHQGVLHEVMRVDCAARAS